MKTLFSVAALCVAMAGGSAHATTYYTDRGDFDAAGAGTSFFGDFDAYTGYTFLPASYGPATLSGVGQIVGSDQVVPGYYGTPNVTGWFQLQLDVGGSTVTGSFDTPVQLIGFDLAAYTDDFGADTNETIAFLTDTGESGTFVTPDRGVTAFLGLAFDAPIGSITFSATDGGGNFYSWFGVDNVQLYGALATTPSVPEPASWAMMIGGLALAGAALRRQRTGVRFA